MLTFKPLDVYDVVDPDESLIEALREYPELREFEHVLTEGEEDQGTWVSWMGPLKTPTESLAKQDSPAIREALAELTPKPKASKTKSREESPKGIWDKLDLL